MPHVEQQTRDAVAALWAKYRARILERLEAPETAVLALVEATLTPELCVAAEREAHKLAGSAGTFGFPVASELARELETAFADGARLEPRDAPRLAELVVELRRILAGSPQALPDLVVRDGGRPRVLLLAEDSQMADRLALDGASVGLDVTAVADAAAAFRALQEGAPDLAILQLQSTLTPDERDLLESLRSARSDVPVLVLTGSQNLAQRVEAARLGASGILTLPLPPARVLEAARRLLERGRLDETCILAVDDDPVVLESLRTLLEPQGATVVALEEPAEFWEALERTSPDLVILDLDMPGLSGLDLCRVVRADARWGRLPILFLTGSVEPDSVHRLFAAGADDYVAKPVVGPELLTRIGNRLDRLALQRRLAERDHLTGVCSRRRSEELLGRLLDRAGRENGPLALAFLDLDRFKSINDRYGHSTGDRVLRRLGELLLQAFPGEDAVVGRWGGEEFAVGVSGSTREQGAARVTRILERLRQEPFTAGQEHTFHATFSAGVAQFPEDGRDVQSLYRAADAALYVAKAAGRDRVVTVGWSPGDAPVTREVDVLVVEDEEALAGLLLHALDTRGYRAEWIGDGAEALAALAGKPPALRARVVVLDVGLPALDGLSLLRRLARDGVTATTRVIMLTARSAESEVVKALELGAFDHVAKPFSVPVLLERIRRAAEL